MLLFKDKNINENDYFLNYGDCGCSLEMLKGGKENAS